MHWNAANDICITNSIMKRRSEIATRSRDADESDCSSLSQRPAKQQRTRLVPRRPSCLSLLIQALREAPTAILAPLDRASHATILLLAQQSGTSLSGGVLAVARRAWGEHAGNEDFVKLFGNTNRCTHHGTPLHLVLHIVPTGSPATWTHNNTCWPDTPSLSYLPANTRSSMWTARPTGIELSYIWGQNSAGAALWRKWRTARNCRPAVYADVVAFARRARFVITSCCHVAHVFRHPFDSDVTRHVSRDPGAQLLSIADVDVPSWSLPANYPHVTDPARARFWVTIVLDESRASEIPVVAAFLPAVMGYLSL